jgi:hypothetical protein
MEFYHALESEESQDEMQEEEQEDGGMFEHETKRPRDEADMEIERDMLLQGLLFISNRKGEEYEESLDLEMDEETPPQSPATVPRPSKRAYKSLEFESSSEEEDQPLKQTPRKQARVVKEESSDDELLDGSQTEPRAPAKTTRDKIKALKAKHNNPPNFMAVLKSCSGFTDVADRVFSGRLDEVKYMVFNAVEDDALMGYDEV